MRVERIISFFDQWETLPLALATKFGPWLTPFVPALFVQRAMVKHMQTPPAWGWLAAVSLEVVGIAAIKSLLRAYTWERERRKTDPPAPIAWNALAAVIYFATAFLLVLVLEFWPEAAKAAPASFVVLSGTSALILALADDQKRRERLVSKMVSKRSAARSATKSVTGQPDQNNGQQRGNDKLLASKKAKQKQAEAALLTYLADHPRATHQEAADAIGRSRPWVTGKLAEFADAEVIRRNGKGVEIIIGNTGAAS